jgi:hypothetical protein
VNRNQHTQTPAVRKAGRRKPVYRGRVSPGGTLPQRLTGMVDKLGVCWLGPDHYAQWRAVSWSTLSKTERQARHAEIWSGFATALNDPATAISVVKRMAACFDAAEIDLVLQDALRPEIRERLEELLLPALRVRRRRRPWGRNTFSWVRPLSPAARALAALPGRRTPQDFAALLVAAIGES